MINKGFQAWPFRIYRGKVKILVVNRLFLLGWFLNSNYETAYAMQSLRSNMGDVHESKPYLAILAFDSLKWAMLISLLLREKL